MMEYFSKSKRIAVATSILIAVSLTLAGLQGILINVSASVVPLLVHENHLDFGLVFPGENRQKNFTVHYVEGSGQESVDYWIIQKIKPLPQAAAPEDYNGSVSDYCQDNPQDYSRCYRNLCPFLTKLSEEGEGDIEENSSVGKEDISDQWIIYFEVPAIRGSVAQDHTGGIIDEDGIYGCDISINVQGEPSFIHGYKFHDLNRNSEWDSEEISLSGWMINLLKKVDEIYVPSETGEAISSNTILENGKNYIIASMGRYRYLANPIEGTGMADAEYSDRESSSYGLGWIKGEGTGNAKLEAGYLDLMINGTNIDWGSYNADSHYEYMMSGTGSRLTFNIMDDYYADNSGGLTVAIYEWLETQITDDNGYYKFSNVDAGTYALVETLQVGWVNSLPGNEGYLLTIEQSDQIRRDFGNYQNLICDPDLELIVNGGFEEPAVAHSSLWDIYDSSSVPGWQAEWISWEPDSFEGVERPQEAFIEIQRGVNGWLSAEGLQYAELDSDWQGPDGALNGEPASIVIYQDLPTIPGEIYKIDFSFSARPNQSEDENILEFSWDGAIKDTLSKSGSGQVEWIEHSYSFTAATSATRIQFSDLGMPNSLGTFLDNISVKCQPYQEPYCGDGTVDDGEECDDGNNEDGDGCSSQCLIEGSGGPYCGDGKIDEDEECEQDNHCQDDYYCSLCSCFPRISTGGGGGGGGGTIYKPRLHLEKSVDNPNPKLGETIVYNLEITNIGNQTGEGLTLDDFLPEGLIYTDTGLLSKHWDLGSISAGQVIGVSYEVNVNINAAAGEYVNTAIAKIINGGPPDNEAVAHQSINIIAKESFSDDRTIVLGEEAMPKPTLVKQIKEEYANPGAIINYGIEIFNSGDIALYDAQVKDTLPEGFTYLETGDKTKTFIIGTIEPGETIQLEYMVQVSDSASAGMYTNTAVLTSTNHDPISANASIEVRLPRVLGEEADIPDTGINLENFVKINILGLLLVFLGLLLIIARKKSLNNF